MDTNTPDPQAESGSWDDLIGALANDEAIDGDAPAPEQPTPDTLEPEQAPVAEPASPVEASADPIPAWDGQPAAGAAFKALREEKAAEATARAKAEQEAAFLRGMLEQQKLAAAPAPTPVVDKDPKPDPSTYTQYPSQEAADQAYFDDTVAWNVRQATAQLRAELAPIQQQQAQSAADASLQVVYGKLGEAEWTRRVAAFNAFDQANPELGLAARVTGGGAQAGAIFERIVSGLVAPLEASATPTPKTPALPAEFAGLAHLAPAEQQAALKAIAAARAASGAAPPSPALPLGPRGVGSAVAGVGAPDGIYTEEAIQTLKTFQQTQAAGRSIYGNLD